MAIAAFSDEIAEKIIALGLCTAIENDLFVNTKARIPNTGEGPWVSVRETGGTAAMKSHSSQYPQPSVQIMVRARKSSVAKAKARALWSALGNLHNVTLSGSFYLKVTAVQDVIDMSVEEGTGLARFAFNLNATTT